MVRLARKSRRRLRGVINLLYSTGCGARKGDAMSGKESRGISRRRFLKTTAAAGLGTAAAAGGITTAGMPKAAAEPGAIPPHGAELRGLDLVIQGPRLRAASGSCSRPAPAAGRDGLVNGWRIDEREAWSWSIR